MGHEIADTLDRQIGRTIAVGITRVLPLAWEDRGDPVTPDILDRVQDPRLVVHENVMARGIALLDIIQRLLLVDVDQHVALHRLGDPGPLDLAGLEDNVAVRQDHGGAPGAEPLQDVERSRVEAIGEGIVDEERRHRGEVDVPRVLAPVVLQRPEIVAIAELHEQRLEDRPVPVAGYGTEFPLEMALEVVLHPIVVEERVVHVDEEGEGRRRRHDAAAIEAPGRGMSATTDRAEARVSSSSDEKADAESISAVQRQRQFPSARPGWFIRASLPRLRTSWRGAIASPATDDHARRKRAGAASAALPAARPTGPPSLRRAASGRAA